MIHCKSQTFDTQINFDYLISVAHCRISMVSLDKWKYMFTTYIYIYNAVFVYLIFIFPFSIYEDQIVSVKIISRLIYYCGKMHELCCNVIKYYLRRYPGDVMWYTCTLLLDPRQIIIHLSFDISLHLIVILLLLLWVINVNQV